MVKTLTDVLKGLFQWDNLLATKIIKGFYYWGLIVLGMIGAGLLLTSLGLLVSHGVIAGLIALLLTLVLVTYAVIVLRVVCEVALIFFLIHENVVAIRDNQAGANRAAFPVNAPAMPTMQAHLATMSSR